MKEMICPHCGSESTYKSKKYGHWICEDCGEKFSESVEAQKAWNDGLEEAVFWNDDFLSVAPVSLAVSYQKLKEYVVDGNIGCTLFLIRDVFELMIKIPVTIMFNGVHDLRESYPDFDKILAANKQIEKLYDYSIQMLSTGKWWECVRLAADIKADLWDKLVEDYPQTSLLKDTCEYLSKIYKLLFFRIPGNPKISMVTWRNRVLGHSCLADNIQEKYVEIPYILKMFQQVCEVSVPFYSMICFCDRNKKPLFGINANLSEAEVFIQYKNESGKQDIMLIIHDFLAGRDKSLSCFDGFEKGKAYLLSYSSGERYRDFKLSEYLTRHGNGRTKKLIVPELSSEDVFSDNLESKDIEALEELLSTKDDVIGINCLYQWLLDSIADADKGILFLSAERGRGKSTFCTTIDQLDRVGVQKMDEALLEQWYELESDTAIRVWHFNSDYRGRKDIFIPCIRDSVLTLGNDTTTRNSSRGNILKGKLEAQWNSLLTCDNNLRKLLFAECLNDTLSEYRERTDKKKLLLVLDGIDEVTDVKELFSFLPDAEHLEEGVYLMLSCRTVSELENKPELLTLIEKCRFASNIKFTRKSLIREASGVEIVSGNDDYNFAIAEYIKDILAEQGKSICENDIINIAEMFENRFSAVAAYRELCRLNPIFTDCVDGNLFQLFITQIEQNAPSSYLQRVKAILNTLLWADEPLTIQELAYLSGERYVSYRMLGLLNDLRAFVRVSRSSQGNRYEIAHSQWKESIRAWMPYGDVYFRQRCSMLLEELEQSFTEDNILDLFSENYIGELWVFTHILSIYSRNKYDLLENWWELIRIGSFEALFDKLITFVDSHEDVRLLASTKFINLLKSVSSDYRKTLSDFSYDPDGERGYKYYNKQSNEYYLLEKIVSFLSHVSKLIIDDYTDLDGEARRNPALSVAAELRFHAGELLLYHSVLRGEDSNSRSRLRKRALELFELSRDTVHWWFDRDKTIIIEVNMRMGDIHFRNQEYEYAYMDYARIIKKLTNMKTISVDMGLALAKAYMEIGPVIPHIDDDYPPAIYLGKLEQINCYQRACDMISGYLKDNPENALILELYQKASNRIGNTFFKQKYYKEAQYWYKESFLTIAKLHYADKREEYNVCYFIGNTCMKLLDFEMAREYYERAYRICCSSQFDRTKVLTKLIQVYESLKMQKSFITIREEYNSLVEEQERYHDAYQEVLEVLRYVPAESVKKIPTQMLNTFRELQNREHGFKVDTSKSFAEQSIMEETEAIFANIFRDYWAIDKQREMIEQHEDRELMENRAKLMQELIERIASVISSCDKAINIVSTKAYCEAFWLLEHLPPTITRKVPIDILLEIKSKRDRSYSIHLSTDGGNVYLEDTLYYLDRLFRKYVPDMEILLSDYCENIPSDFDLNCIFEDDFE